MEGVPMKKQYIAAVACLMAGAIGFIGVYANNLGQQKKQVAQEVEQQEEINDSCIDFLHFDTPFLWLFANGNNISSAFYYTKHPH